MKFTIEDLKNGKCAVKNDGSVEELREVLTRAFPDDSATTSGGTWYYMKMDRCDKNWNCSDSTDLPYQSVKDFLTKKLSVEEMVTIKNFHAFIQKCIDAYFNKDKHVDITKWYGDFDD